ncbi:hypothetical protein VTJ49DRAFT_1110 [Mycothermus thermophilus]|uniref:Rhodopsin domain-containing protein n=1 Tax=Humicola insolens TaxID=85995 RepID=A0ABR3VP23_HUMIN
MASSSTQHVEVTGLFFPAQECPSRGVSEHRKRHHRRHDDGLHSVRFFATDKPSRLIVDNISASREEPAVTVKLGQLGADDYMCVVGLLAIYGTGIAIAHMTKYGLGRHVYAMAPTDIPLYMRDFYVSIVMYCSALLFLKMTFLLQYYRVLAVAHMRTVYLVSMFIVGGWALSQVMVGIFTCTPVSGFWDFTIESKCIPNQPQWYINAAGNIITDVAVFCLPLPAILKLHLARGSKLILLGIFCLGFFTVIISGIRIRYLKVTEDFSWWNIEPSLWSCIELTSALTCACLPTLRPLLTRVFPSLGSQSTISGGGPPALESQVGRTHHDRKALEDSAESTNRSDVELTPTSPVAADGLRANPFEVHVVHEVSMGVERGSAWPNGQLGVRGYVEKPAWGH